jgi:hypothetical protein
MEKAVRDSERDDLFARARKDASPTDDDRRRVRGAIHRRLGVGAGTAVATTALKAAASTAGAGTVAAGTVATGTAGASAASVTATAVSLSAVGVVKITAVIAAIAAAAVVASTGLPHFMAEPAAKKADVVEAVRPVTTTRPVAATPAMTAAPLSAPPHVDPIPAAPAVTNPLPVAASPMRERAAPGPQPSDLPVVVDNPAPPPPRSGTEVDLMADVQAALRVGDAPRVLALVSEHERRFPESALAPEREGARVLAVCASAAPDEARTQARRFLSTYPLSPLGGRVRATCGVTDGSR